MKIQIGHSSAMNFVEDLYNPLKNSNLYHAHERILPHEDDNRINARESLKSVDIFIADVSLPSIGLGIELGICMNLGVNIACIAKKGSSVSDTVKKVTSEIIIYNDNLIEQISNILDS